jgi:hypothetical protein
MVGSSMSVWDIAAILLIVFTPLALAAADYGSMIPAAVRRQRWIRRWSRDHGARNRCSRKGEVEAPFRECLQAPPPAGNTPLVPVAGDDALKGACSEALRHTLTQSSAERID